ncbi:ExeM/NucH family extracellular endonuclease [Reinekea marina]|uniref:ExeM/NucH family extracellular endonuclease n=1 Tax=Reinekea marina TaxID=1310421 RepID=A0ABV7WSY3_9GAMM|nr:ExeM/NucH family extracellular endonuclease [Reinekea marina]MDN3649237.1 ExeM/NucH family extracellular endonuclease [Reinekea marina]
MTLRTPLIVGILLANAAYADVLLTEYIEGSSYNKALELTNFDSNPADLSPYSIELYSNGATTATNILTLSGALAPNSAYVVANSRAVPQILNVADITDGVANFNGNDVVLLKKNGIVVDSIGQLGNSTTFAANVTLTRKSDTLGDANPSDSFDYSTSWNEHPSNTFTYLGNGAPGEDPVEPPSAFNCADPATKISEVQGNGSASPILGQVVDIEAIVVADLQASNQAKGFFVQSLDTDVDADPQTSEGLFIYHYSTDVAVGDKVRVRGEADEFYGLTQLTSVSDITICSSGNSLPMAATLNLPFSSENDLEALEGMRVTASSPLMVNEVYALGRYGEFMVANGRRRIPTDVALPGPDADAIHAANDLNMLIVDDGFKTQNPDPVIFPAPALDANNTLRIGNTVTNLTGVINFNFGKFKLIPTTAPVFNGDNPRTLEPTQVAESDLRIASFNVLNYFNGDGLGGGFPTPRGADNAYELERQTAKLVAAMTAIDADVIGLMEIENDGFADTSAIADLVRAINVQQSAENQYQYINPGVAQIGDDAIAVGIIYRPSVVQPAGVTAILDSSNSPLNELGEPLFDDSRNRPALTQTFKSLDGAEAITMVVNHFKSKGSRNCGDIADCDEGQGAYNQTRTNAALALTQWLESNPTGVETDKVLIMGDLNAYSKEDPIRAIESAGFNQLKQDGDYSYVFDGETGSLDQALASNALAEKVIHTQDWHINTDEPLILDYNTEYKSDAQVLSLYAPDAYRSSDHDPVIIDVALNEAPNANIRAYRFLFWYIFVSDSHDNDGYIASHTWTLGNLEITKPWFFIAKRYVHKNHLDSISLTVEDDEGAQVSVTESFR